MAKWALREGRKGWEISEIFDTKEEAFVKAEKIAVDFLREIDYPEDEIWEELEDFRKKNYCLDILEITEEK